MICLQFSDNGDLLLASAAQDTLIRVWRITQRSNNKDKIDLSIKQALQSNQGEFSINYKDEFKFKCQLETVLQGHENWVYGLHWQSPVLKGYFEFLPKFILTYNI